MVSVRDKQFFFKYLHSWNDAGLSFFFYYIENMKTTTLYFLRKHSCNHNIHLFRRASFLYIGYEYACAKFRMFPLQNHYSQTMRTLETKYNSFCCYSVLFYFFVMADYSMLLNISRYVKTLYFQTLKHSQQSSDVVQYYIIVKRMQVKQN